MTERLLTQFSCFLPELVQFFLSQKLRLSLMLSYLPIDISSLYLIMNALVYLDVFDRYVWGSTLEELVPHELYGVPYSAEERELRFLLGLKS